MLFPLFSQELDDYGVDSLKENIFDTFIVHIFTQSYLKHLTCDRDTISIPCIHIVIYILYSHCYSIIVSCSK